VAADATAPANPTTDTLNATLTNGTINGTFREVAGDSVLDVAFKAKITPLPSGTAPLPPTNGSCASTADLGITLTWSPPMSGPAVKYTVIRDLPDGARTQDTITTTVLNDERPATREVFSSNGLHFVDYEVFSVGPTGVQNPLAKFFHASAELPGPGVGHGDIECELRP
jgi:hypothetical protein